MQNYKNTPRVRQLQKQSRIQSLTFSQLSQPKTVQKIRKVQQKLNCHKSVPKIQQWIPMNTAIQKSVTQANKQQQSIQQYHHNQSINQYNIGYAPNKQKINHNIQISQNQ